MKIQLLAFVFLTSGKEEGNNEQENLVSNGKGVFKLVMCDDSLDAN